MLLKIAIGLLCVIVTLVCVAVVSTVMTYAIIVREAKTINQLEKDIKIVQEIIDMHKRTMEE